ncbi:septum formation initiator family protein [Comamonas endophytica]|uniref:Cell division protein FtsB n=1 Tax=Comamonas endophytica TaxID=2949090 RepID=A0ABY6GBC5_9BURK|nr:MULTISPECIES: septum formation initiator family protein [unclassified Acidovorax]MCD2513633.1 septum formation initiator family protein [Acidovorax sp. D4N7]UYG52359.1 septum formation initiator family protein [Acidovorax sp. 5MLIR]
MVNRIVPLVLLVLLGAVHAQLWLGHGSVAYVQELKQQIAEQNAANAVVRSANERLQVEVNDLKNGLEMVEAKARSELGMLKPNEIFVQVMHR